mgnify:CR=1 FL=1
MTRLRLYVLVATAPVLALFLTLVPARASTLAPAPAVIAAQAAVPVVAAADGSTPDPVGVWPLDPEPAVVAGFDPPTLIWGSGHRGVDLAGSPGQQVRAALAGTVSFAGTVAGKPVVVVAHGTTRTTYEPVAAAVQAGQEVGAGDLIGWLLAPFSHCYPSACLHWGWREQQEYLDPLRLVDAIGPVRLLPLWDAPADQAPAWPAPGAAGLTLAGAPGGRPAAGGPW